MIPIDMRAVIGCSPSMRQAATATPCPPIIDRGWHPQAIIGGHGVAVAACRMLGLDPMTARMAMGIMASSVSGVRKNVGSMGKAFHVGNTVRAGLFALMLARNKFAVDPDIIEGAVISRTAMSASDSRIRSTASAIIVWSASPPVSVGRSSSRKTRPWSDCIRVPVHPQPRSTA